MGQVVKAASNTTAMAVAEAPAQYLTFSLSGEMFGLGILNVKEIIEYGNLTEIPMMPAFIRGVINLRGSVVPVIDLAARFGGQPTAVGRRTCIVIVEVPDEDTRHDIGIIVDAVSEVLEIPGSDIEPPPPSVPRFGPISSSAWARSPANSSSCSTSRRCCRSRKSPC